MSAVAGSDLSFFGDFSFFLERRIDVSDFVGLPVSFSDGLWHVAPALCVKSALPSASSPLAAGMPLCRECWNCVPDPVLRERSEFLVTLHQVEVLFEDAASRGLSLEAWDLVLDARFALSRSGFVTDRYARMLSDRITVRFLEEVVSPELRSRALSLLPSDGGEHLLVSSARDVFPWWGAAARLAPVALSCWVPVPSPDLLLFRGSLGVLAALLGALRARTDYPSSLSLAPLLPGDSPLVVETALALFDPDGVGLSSLSACLDAARRV